MFSRMLAGGYRLDANQTALSLYHNDRKVLELPMAPRDGGNSTHSVQRATLGATKDGLIVSTDAGETRVDVQDSRFTWTLKSSASFCYDRLTLFPEGKIAAKQWHSFLFNGQDRNWDISEDVSIEAMSCNKVIGHVDAIWFTDVAPRVVAFELENGEWLAISIPGPLPVAGTRFNHRDGCFSIDLEHYRPTCEGAPAVQIVFQPGLPDAESALDVHAAATRELGIWRDRTGHPQWWAQPRWGVFDELTYVGNTSLDPPDARNSPLTRERIEAWSDRIADFTGVRGFSVFFDQGYFQRYGEYVPVESIGGLSGFRKVLDAQREKGRRSGLYMHQYFVDRRIPEIAAHPEWLVQGVEPKAVPVSGDMQLGMIDWTHPEARQYMHRMVRRIVSDEDGCLNADWLMINNNHVPDPRKARFHNPDWGIGDRMAYRVMNEIRDVAKQCKSDCLVSFIGADSFLQTAPDLCWVNESWWDTCDNTYQMARILTRLLPGTLISANPYILSHGKFAEFLLMSAAYGIPAAMPLSQIHTHGHSKQWQEMTEENLRRWGAAWQVYENAPMTADQQRRVSFDGERLEAWRKYSSGPLKGFYAALGLRRRTLVTYSASELRAATMDWGVYDLPLPTNAEIQSCHRVLDDGVEENITPVILARDGMRYLRLAMEDSGSGLTGKGTVRFYRARYRLD